MTGRYRPFVRIFPTMFALSIMLLAGLAGNSYGHIVSDYGKSNIAGYTISFTPVPTVPVPGETSTLKFGMQDPQGLEVSFVFATVTVESLTNDKIVSYTFPERLYEFGDISLNYNFPEDGLYKVTLDARIKKGDTIITEQYQTLSAGFEVPVGSYNPSLSFTDSFKNIVWVGFVAAGVALGAYALMYRKIKRVKNNS